MSEELSNVFYSIYNSKLPIAEKYHFQPAMDEALGDYGNVHHENEINAINVTQALDTLLEKNLKGKMENWNHNSRWNESLWKSKKHSLHYENLVTIPNERIGKIVIS